MDEVDGKSAPTFPSRLYLVESLRGRTPARDEHHSRRPLEVGTPEMTDRIHDMMLKDRRVKFWKHLYLMVSISQRKLSKISAKRLPRFQRKCVSIQSLVWRFLVPPRGYKTVVETWTHQYTPKEDEGDEIGQEN